VFFQTLGIKWWYEPEGFSLQFDYEDFAADWEQFAPFWATVRERMVTDEHELLSESLPQTFKHLDGKEYSYLPDFYLPEFNYWIEIKGPNPTREEMEKAFLLDHMAMKAGKKKVDEAKTRAEVVSAINEVEQRGVYIIYGDIPWPHPSQSGNICGYRGFESGSTFFDILRRAKAVAGEPPLKEREYRGLLYGSLRLCWQECPLCLKIGIEKIGAPFCQSCHRKVAGHIRNHLASYPVISEAGPQDTSNLVMRNIAWTFDEDDPNPTSIKAMELTKDLMNPEFFASGHKSPRLQKAYSAARSAQWEHGKSP
jgi:hypothetical protein